MKVFRKTDIDEVIIVCKSIVYSGIKIIQRRFEV